jgi:hypothetical protein
MAVSVGICVPFDNIQKCKEIRDKAEEFISTEDNAIK